MDALVMQPSPNFSEGALFSHFPEARSIYYITTAATHPRSTTIIYFSFNFKRIAACQWTSSRSHAFMLLDLPATKRFFKRCVARADNLDRDVDLYHWSSAKFESTWRDTLSVLVARGRAQVGVHSAKTDWSRRILGFQYMGYDDQAAHIA